MRPIQRLVVDYKKDENTVNNSQQNVPAQPTFSGNFGATNAPLPNNFGVPTGSNLPPGKIWNFWSYSESSFYFHSDYTPKIEFLEFVVKESVMTFYYKRPKNVKNVHGCFVRFTEEDNTTVVDLHLDKQWEIKGLNKDICQ